MNNTLCYAVHNVVVLDIFHRDTEYFRYKFDEGEVGRLPRKKIERWSKEETVFCCSRLFPRQMISHNCRARQVPYSSFLCLHLPPILFRS